MRQVITSPLSFAFLSARPDLRAEHIRPGLATEIAPAKPSRSTIKSETEIGAGSCILSPTLTGVGMVFPTIDTGGAPIPLLDPVTDVEEELRSQLLVSTVDKVFGWARRSSLWPAMFGLACCAIEMIATANARYDLARFGAEVFRASPRQADLMIVAGTVTWKMAPPVRRIYLQMAEPKWVISMGSCSNIGGPFAHGYSTLPGVNNVVPVDVYVPGCPPRPESLLAGLMLLQQVIDDEHAHNGRKRRPEPTGDFSKMLPEGDPIRAELESLFPPFLTADGQPRDRFTGALPHDQNFYSSR